ncbi:hypothetical protein B0T17DRAFT_494325, partial [Bombardia bombarda]
IQNGHSGTRSNGDEPLPSSPPMSNTQPPPGAPRQPVSYTSPTHYPSAGMSAAAQYAYPPQQVPSVDTYRPSPNALPSMRTLDHQQQQQQQQHAMSMGAHIAGPMGSSPTPMGYYGVHPHAYAMHPDPTGMRFAIAPGLPPDPRIALSGGRHKKEIKRRTKTGCLTCRKRRIKCDEAHPSCNNCKKSKRECLGYDPIFKQQQGPAAIQPAPNTQSSAPSTLASAPTLPSSTAAHSYQPPVIPSSYAASLPSNITFDSSVASTPQSVKTDGGFDYSTAIDPALQGADASSTASASTSQYQPIRTEVIDKNTAISSQLRAKMKVDELIAPGGAAPPTPSSPPSHDILDEITRLYYEVYVPGLTQFFETQWYNFNKNTAGSSNPTPSLRNHQPLINLFASFLKNIMNIKSTDPADMVYSGHLESRIVWMLASLPASYAPKDTSQGYSGLTPAEEEALEACNRLRVFETLLSGELLSSNPLSPPPPLSPLGSNSNSNNCSPARRNELEFWHHLAQYLLRSHSSNSTTDHSTREHYLNAMRSLLDGRENRDVLYSVVVLREYTAHWDAALNEQTVPSHLEGSEPRSKLAVATRFIRDESASTGGTTNVVRRFAELAYRAFVRPGVNVNR